jgi:hypothetical protein
MSTAGKHYRFRKLEFWAESGMINLIDERHPPEHPGSFKVIMVREWLERLNTLNKEIHRWNKYVDERNEMSNFIDNGIACVRDAKKQGRPDDPKAAADILKSRRKTHFIGTGQSTILHTASASSAPEGLLLPPMPGIQNDRTEQKKIIIP